MKTFFCSSPKNFEKKRCSIEIFEIVLFDYFSQIVLIEGETKIKKCKFWPYFPQIVLIKSIFIKTVLIDRNHSNEFQGGIINDFINLLLFIDL